MNAPKFCGQCGKQLRRDENGDVCCPNAHPQVHDGLAQAFRELLPILVDLREDFRAMDKRTDEQLEALRTEVNVVVAVVGSAPPEPAALVGMAEMCRLLGVDRDWMYRDDRRRRLGRYQERKNARWRFDPGRTRALFEQLYGQEPREDPPLPAVPARPRQLPGSVPLLDVKGRAA